MGRYVFKLPDVGEGTAEAEIVAWHVAVGDSIEEDQNLVDVMTDKATVEMTSPVSGKVISLHGEPGQMAAVGSALVELEVEGAGNAAGNAATKPAPTPKDKKESSLAPVGGEGRGEGGAASTHSEPPKSLQHSPPHPDPLPQVGAREHVGVRTFGDKPLASPAVRQRARDLGIELQYVPGSGPAGRIGHADLDAYVSSGGSAASARPLHAQRDGVEEVKVIGLRRKIAEKMQEVQTPYSALRLCRGNRHDGAGRSARAPEQDQACRPAEIECAAFFDPSIGANYAGLSADQRPFR